MKLVMRKTLSFGIILLWGVMLGTAPAHAGRSCEERKMTRQAIESGLTMAEQTLKALEASGDRVVLLARAGQDLSKYGLRYSHVGFAYQQSDGKGGHTWRVVHKLNLCGTAQADIYRQGLAEFFLDDPWQYEASWVAPQPEIQARLLPLLQDNALAAQMQHQPYSMVSYVWGRQYQQSNQWLLETFAAAVEPSASSRERAQAWLQFRGYEPTTLKIGTLTRLGARITGANVAFDDHPNEKRFSDRIETVTVDSVFSWLQKQKLGQAPVTLRLKP